MTLSDDQFGETISRRHETNSPFTADEVESMTDEQYHAVLNDVATRQRGGPESAMSRAQAALGGGLLPHSLEHIGDLTHRMNEAYATSTGFSREFVSPKVESQLRYLRNAYGYDREVGEQMTANSRFRESRGKPPITEDTVDGALTPYVLAHHQLPVYNKPGYHAKAAAVHIGLRNTDKATEHLEALDKLTSDPEVYRQSMSRTASVDWLRSLEPGQGPN